MTTEQELKPGWSMVKMTICGWNDVKEHMPPRHEDLFFLTDCGHIFEGRMCYGMHPPYFSANFPENHGYILNGKFNVTHWAKSKHLLPTDFPCNNTDEMPPQAPSEQREGDRE